jgi:hypothetical protein
VDGATDATGGEEGVVVETAGDAVAENVRSEDIIVVVVFLPNEEEEDGCCMRRAREKPRGLTSPRIAPGIIFALVEGKIYNFE